MALFSFTRLALGRRGFSATTKLRGLSWTPELEHYVDDVGVCESKHCAALRSRSFESMSQRQAAMQVSPLQGQFLAHMVRTMVGLQNPLLFPHVWIGGCICSYVCIFLSFSFFLPVVLSFSSRNSRPFSLLSGRTQDGFSSWAHFVGTARCGSLKL